MISCRRHSAAQLSETNHLISAVCWEVMYQPFRKPNCALWRVPADIKEAIDTLEIEEQQLIHKVPLTSYLPSPCLLLSVHEDAE